MPRIQVKYDVACMGVLVFKYLIKSETFFHLHEEENAVVIRKISSDSYI